MKVLIIKLSAFGDIIHALPALDDILKRPEVTEVHWLVDERFAFVCDVFPTEVKIHSIAMKGQHPIQAIWKTIRSLRQEHFDVIIDLQSLIKSSLIAKLIGGKIYGLDATEVKEKPATWIQESVTFHSDDKNIVQKCRRVASGPWQSASVPTKSMPYIAPHIHKGLPHMPIPSILDHTPLPWVILNLGGSWATKQLPNTTWVHIAKGIEQRGAQAIICWGNKQEQEKALHIANECQAIPLPERLDILTLCSLFLHSASVITTDTGILHLASALKTPTISFWGVTPSVRNGAFGEHDIQVESNPECGPCIKRTCANFICMDMIDAETILQHLDQQLLLNVPQGDNVA